MLPVAAYAGRGSWTSRGPAGDSRVPSRIYDAADIFSSDVWRSDDGGEKWQATAPIADFSTNEIVVGNDPASSVFVTGSKGVWRSPDLGEHWSLDEGLPPALLAVDPRFEGVVYAAGLSSNAEFFVSRDAGATWSPLTSSGFPGEPILDLVASSSGRLFAVTASGIFELDLVSVLPVERRQPITIKPPFHPQP